MSMALAAERADYALQKAMEQFWAVGIEATPYPELVKVTGLSRKALYQQWPDKTRLVHDALDRYRKSVLTDQCEIFKTPGPAAVTRFWDALEAAVLPEWQGCFLLRSAAGELRHDEKARQMYTEHLSTIQRGIMMSLKGHHKDPAGAAWQAVGVMTLVTALAGQGMPLAMLKPVFAAGRAATAF